MAIKLSVDRKKEIINNEFHQFFNITLKSANSFYRGFTHNIAWSQYQSTSRETILNKYSNTSIQIDYSDVCEKVVDGDTIVLQSGERIRLVGINTPEKSIQGYDTSKKFVEKICLNQTVGIHYDHSKKYDKYGRTLAVVIVNNKNLNQILLKEKLAEIMYIPPSEFNPSSWDNTAPVSNDDDTLLSTHLANQFMNVVIPLEEIGGENYGIGDFMEYFNDDYSNVVVTNVNDFNILYKCESYQKTLFIRVEPITVENDNTITITLHLLPKRYDGTDDILIFKDNYSFLNDKRLQLQKQVTNRFYKVHQKYKTDSKGNYILNNMQDKIPINIINAYFQSGLNGQNRKDRAPINNSPYPEFDKFDSARKFYQDYNSNNQWIQEDWGQPYDSNKEMYTEFDCDISQYSGNLTNIQINACYSYNQSSPTNAVHYMGCKDTSNYDMADRCSLIDANLDKIINGKSTTNYISQFEYINNKPHFPISINTVQQNNSYTHKHTDNIGEKHHKTIKYFNDRLYSEEKSIRNNEVIKHGYTVGDWTDLSQ